MTFARLRISVVTSSGMTWNIFAAVARCTSSSRANASQSASSPERCAMMRSSICE